jgi:hypothetical protein
MKKSDWGFVLLGCKGKSIVRVRVEDLPKGTMAVPFVLSGGRRFKEAVKILLGDAGITLIEAIQKKNGDKPSKTTSSRTPKK